MPRTPKTKRKNKPPVKSKANRHPKTGSWGQNDRNANTFRKIDRAISEENDVGL